MLYFIAILAVVILVYFGMKWLWADGKEDVDTTQGEVRESETQPVAEPKAAAKQVEKVAEQGGKAASGSRKKRRKRRGRAKRRSHTVKVDTGHLLNHQLDKLRLPVYNGFARFDYDTAGKTKQRPESFIAMDVETANEQPFSICAIGITEVRQGEIIGSEFMYVRPLEEYFAAKNTQIHGIDWEMVKSAPLFKEVWEQKLAAKLANSIMVAHYAPFDVGCILYTLRASGLRQPSLRYIDTVEVSRECFRLPRNRLVDVMDYLGIGKGQHHQADFDSRVAAQALLKALEDQQYLPTVWRV